jgi:hypothetical protein
MIKVGSCHFFIITINYHHELTADDLGAYDGVNKAV